MNTTTHQYIGQTVTGLAAIHGAELPEVAAALWLRFLDGYTIPQLKIAFERHGRRSRWMPKPAEIIAILEGTDEDSQERLKADGERAWLAAVRAVGAVGMYNSPSFDDPATTQAIALMGGWPWFCQMDDRQEPFERNRFIALYIKARLRHDEPSELFGIADRQERVPVSCGTQHAKALVEAPLKDEQSKERPKKGGGVAND